MTKRPAPGTWLADSSHFSRPTRREFLRAGWLGGLGISLGDLLAGQSRAEERTGGKIEPQARSVIQIYLQGGFAHMDSFDPKPDSPVEYRGTILDSNLTMLIAGERRPLHLVASPLLLVGFVYLVFVAAFGVRLP